jgi:hypothetical protein
MSRGIRIPAHGAKLQHLKRRASLTDPDLTKQRAAGRIEADKDRNHNQ